MVRVLVASPFGVHRRPASQPSCGILIVLPAVFSAYFGGFGRSVGQPRCATYPLRRPPCALRWPRARRDQMGQASFDPEFTSCARFGLLPRAGQDPRDDRRTERRAWYVPTFASTPVLAFWLCAVKRQLLFRCYMMLYSRIAPSAPFFLFARPHLVHLLACLLLADPRLIPFNVVAHVLAAPKKPKKEKDKKKKKKKKKTSVKSKSPKAAAGGD